MRYIVSKISIGRIIEINSTGLHFLMLIAKVQDLFQNGTIDIW
jgi:hypothetical protein